jgi:Dirigent-like protein
MDKKASGTPRRTLLQRTLLLLGASVALGGAEKEVFGDHSPPVVKGGSSTVIYGRRRQLHTAGRRPGESGNGRMDSYGELWDRPDGAKVGDFHSTCLCLDSPYGSQSISAFNVEFQTLNMKEGTLIGMGTAGTSGKGMSVHAVVGGTGRYAGARGSYVLRPSAGEQGGQGMVEFVLTLLD